MDPHKLLHLAAIIENGSLAKAGKALGISQPSLTKSMNRLEQELGITLLERKPTGAEPTSAGELVYTHARLIRDEMQTAAARLQGRESQSDVVTLGVLPTLASHIVPVAIAQWKRLYPEVQLRLVEKVQIELLWGLLRGEFDFVIGQTEFFDVALDGLKQRVLFRDHLNIYARAGHELFSQREVTLSDLARFPWVCPLVGGRQRNLLDKLMADAGIQSFPRPIEGGSVDFMKALLASSDYVAMLPEHAITSGMNDIVLKPLPIVIPALKRDIAVILHERRPLGVASLDLVAQIRLTAIQLMAGTAAS